MSDSERERERERRRRLSGLSGRCEVDRGPAVCSGHAGERMGQEARVSPLKNFVAGGVAGACLLLAGHPLDTIKVTDCCLKSICHSAQLYLNPSELHLDLDLLRVSC